LHKYFSILPFLSADWLQFEKKSLKVLFFLLIDEKAAKSIKNCSIKTPTDSLYLILD